MPDTAAAYIIIPQFYIKIKGEKLLCKQKEPPEMTAHMLCISKHSFSYLVTRECAEVSGSDIENGLGTALAFFAESVCGSCISYEYA